MRKFLRKLLRSPAPQGQPKPPGHDDQLWIPRSTIDVISPGRHKDFLAIHAYCDYYGYHCTDIQELPTGYLCTCVIDLITLLEGVTCAAPSAK